MLRMQVRSTCSLNPFDMFRCLLARAKGSPKRRLSLAVVRVRCTKTIVARGNHKVPALKSGFDISDTYVHRKRLRGDVTECCRARKCRNLMSNGCWVIDSVRQHGWALPGWLLFGVLQVCADGSLQKLDSLARGF